MIKNIKIDETYRFKILDNLYKINSENRVKHILGVEEFALYLADIYNVNYEKVQIAALLHDYTKGYDLETSLNIVAKYDFKCLEIEKRSVNLLHSKTAFLIAKYEYGILDEEILNAIKYHTTGRDNMSLLEKIIFVSDALEKNRVYEGVDDLRELAKNNLDETILKIIDNNINFLIKTNKQIHVDTIICRNYIIDLRS